MIRFQVVVDEQTYSALRALARQEYRDWHSQAGFLIREMLLKSGHLEQPQQPQNPSREPEAGQAEE